MQTIKTSDLTGAALDWAVAKCEGIVDGKDFSWYYDRRDKFNYSTDWAQGGPIIEREHISIEATRVGGLGDRWMCSDMVGYCTEFSDTPLTAAMRCYVASKLGDTVQVPAELTI